jgi:DNA-binding HxlR family transcriptional regulator
MATGGERHRLKSKSFKRSDCPLACALDILGDKWTLLIVRDLFFGRTRYNEFLDSGEGIPTNILTQRLRHLEEAGLIHRRAYQERPTRYEYHLTESGRSLCSVIEAMVKWSRGQIPGTRRSRIE